MSMNAVCFLVVGGVKTEVPLVQTPTEVSFRICFADGLGIRKDKRPWREAAKLYLAWIAESFAPKPAPSRWAGRPVKGKLPVDPYNAQLDAAAARDIIKRERRLIGEAWRQADELGGVLEFWPD